VYNRFSSVLFFLALIAANECIANSICPLLFSSPRTETLTPIQLFESRELIGELWRKANETVMTEKHTDIISTLDTVDQGRPVKIDVFRVKKTPIDVSNGGPHGSEEGFQGDPRWAVQALGSKLAKVIGVEWLQGDRAYDLVLAVDVKEMNRRIDLLNEQLPSRDKIFLHLAEGFAPSEAFLRRLSDFKFSFTSSGGNKRERTHDLSHHLASLVLADKALVNWVAWFNRTYFRWVDFAILNLAAKKYGKTTQDLSAAEIKSVNEDARRETSYGGWEGNYLNGLVNESKLDRTGRFFDNFLGAIGSVVLETIDNLSILPRGILFRPDRDTGQVDTTTTFRNLFFVDFLGNLAVDHSGMNPMQSIERSFRFGSALPTYERDSQFLRQLFVQFQLTALNDIPTPMIDLSAPTPEVAAQMANRLKERRKILNEAAAKVLVAGRKT